MDEVPPADGDVLLDGARRSLAPTSDLDARLAHLDAVVEALRSRTPSAAVDEAATVIARASARLRLSADHTVVALAGATGSGKSSTFNALTGLDVASVGVRRPTTSWAMACLWGSAGAAELLEWLGIPQRHQVVRDSLLDTAGESDELQGMVLLDLPDHDSTEVAHRLEVDRLVHLADVIVWVMDPQKYADAAIHDRLLRPNVQHAGVMVAVVNHMDEVPEEGRDRLYRDARRLLDDDGLSSVPLIATSARVGTGLDELRSVLAARIADKAASRTRISADVDVAAQRLTAEVGSTPSEAGLPALRDGLIASLTEAGETTVMPEVVRNIVREQTRSFAAGANPAVATSITQVALEQTDALVAALREPAPAQAPVVRERGGIRWLPVFLFLVFLGGAGWLAAALVKDVPNVVAAAVVTGVAFLAWLLSVFMKRAEPAARPARDVRGGSVASAVDRTVVAA
ncbi:MAG: GTPase family protein, partial [Marmoricola sp.]